MTNPHQSEPDFTRAWPHAGRAYNETPEGRARIDDAISRLVWLEAPFDPSAIPEASVRDVVADLRLASPMKVTPTVEVGGRELFGIEVRYTAGTMRLYFLVEEDRYVPVACDRWVPASGAHDTDA